MAYRKEVFEQLKFDEKLQRFGGYAFAEDVDFSHRVFLHYEQPLLVSSSGMFIHHSAPGGRLDKRKMCAAIFYNTKVIRDNFNKYTHYRSLPFIWGQRICRTLGLLAMGYSASDIFNGYMDYRKALNNDFD